MRLVVRKGEFQSDGLNAFHHDGRRAGTSREANGVRLPCQQCGLPPNPSLRRAAALRASAAKLMIR